MSRKTAAASALLATFIAGAILAAAPVPASPVPQNVEVLALNENFEGVLGARGWTVGDADLLNGADYWAASNYRASDGNASAWAAGSGDKLTVIDFFTEGFETGNGSFQYADRNSSDSAGQDYWGRSTARAHNGSYSIWCAQTGNNQQYSNAPNAQVRYYDNYMNSTAVVPVNLAGYADVTLEYWFWQNSENSWDNLYVAFFDTAWHFENQKFPNAGAAMGWQFGTYKIPSSAVLVGFMFTSDGSVIYEGAYVDDVRLYATRIDQNRDIHLYDDGMDATMVHDVDVSIFDSARVDYRYWIDTALNDTLQVMLYDGFAWTYVDAHTGTSGGWAASSVAIPTTTVEVGFRFVSDRSGRSEGAYVDEFNVWGSVLPVLCTATAYETSGMEVVTPIHFGATATGGLRPYTWSWVFGDGTTSSAQSPAHSFPDISTYTPVLTVMDTLGQSCSQPTASITIVHDTSTVFVTPATAHLVEGTDVVIYGQDGQGHPYPLTWDLQFPECGVLDTTLGISVRVTVATDSGGSTCTVVGSVGSAYASMRLTVRHDTSTIALTPTSAVVVEGDGIRLSATDRYGDELLFVWATTCGRVGGAAAAFTLFEAIEEGGVVCTVSASFGSDFATSVISIVHDTGRIEVTPRTAALVEGGGQSFAAVDSYGHPFEAAWSVDPPVCGRFSLTAGAATAFTASTDAGGMDCTLVARFGADHSDVAVSVSHDLRDALLSPASASLPSGSVEFTFGDGNGHPFAAVWRISPGGCGAFAPENGSSPTLTVSSDFAGYTCTVSATGIGFTRFASVFVEYGAPASVEVSPTSDVVESDGSVSVTGAVLDGNGHAIPSLVLAWSTSCGSVSPTSGLTTTLSAPRSAAGSSCVVTATYNAISGSASVRVNYPGPFVVRVSPADPTLSGGQQQVFTATVTDAAGVPIPDAAVVWSATCGVLSSTTGSVVTFTAPADLSANSDCRVSAAASAGGVAYQSASAVRTGGSMLLPLIGLAVAAGVGGIVAFRMRGRKGPELAAAPSDAEAAPHAEESPAAPESEATSPPVTMPCPKCGATVETGWTSCPACGTDLAFS